MNNDVSMSPLALENDTIRLSTLTSALDRLRLQSDSLRESYLQGKPYPHLVIDNLFEPETLNRIVADFPKSEDRNWIVWDTAHELKTTSKGIDNLSMFTQLFCLWLNSKDFIRAIEGIVGVDNLVGDPLFFGAGLHEMYQGGWLEMHADYTKHFSLPLMRRFNLLIYLNEDWDSNWGGELALRNPHNPQDLVSYPPYFNRTIIFPTTAKTFHGVPTALTCPLDRSRKLLSIYYWSAIPMPLWSKAGTPLLWASQQKKALKKMLGK